MVPTNKELRERIKEAGKSGDLTQLQVALRDMARYHGPLSHQSVRFYARRLGCRMVLKHTNGVNYHTLTAN